MWDASKQKCEELVVAPFVAWKVAVIAWMDALTSSEDASQKEKAQAIPDHIENDDQVIPHQQDSILEPSFSTPVVAEKSEKIVVAKTPVVEPPVVQKTIKTLGEQ